MAMFSTLLGMLGGGVAGLISAPQRVAITISGTGGTGTITAVNTANTLIFFAGISSGAGANAASDLGCHWVLTNSTTVTATRSGTSGTFTLYLDVCEFTPGFIIQQQMTSVAVSGSGGTNTASISSSSTSRTNIIPYGCTATSGLGVGGSVLEIVWAQNSTTQVQATIGSSFASGTVTAYANVVEFGS